ncbi:MAG: T9SS type A sorting domain-containing protein, partial [Candidatus Kuenenbacteria bacterium]
DSVRLLSQTGKVFCEVFKSDTLTFHVLRALPLGGVFALKDDFGWTGIDTVRLNVFEPDTEYRFFVERRGSSIETASNSIIGRTLKQLRYGTRRNGFIHLPANAELAVKIGGKPKSVVFWRHVMETDGFFRISLESGIIGGATFFSTQVKNKTRRGTDELIEMPIVLGQYQLPDSFYIKLKTNDNSLFFSKADDGLPSQINYGIGWQDIGRIMIAFGYEGDITEVGTETKTAPVSFFLSQNYPNPFNPKTKIAYSIEKAGQVKLTVYNVLGQKVADLVNEFKVANTYKVNFDASNLPGGVYFYRLEVNDYSKTMKMMLLQ